MTKSLVLTLVADHTEEPVIRNITNNLNSLVANHGGKCADPIWLFQEKACDLSISASDEPNLTAALKDSNLLDPLDYCLQPAENRRKKLFLADMDSTIITVECIDELADFVGMKDAVSRITEQAMIGEIEFNEAFRARVAMLKGLNRDVLQKVFEDRVTLTPGAQTLVQTMRHHGTYTALVSGGFTFFTGLVREWVGFHMDMSNELLFEGEQLSGKAAEPILNSAAKLETLLRLTRERNLGPGDSLAVGDGANDIPMIEAAGLGVAYHAKPKAAAAANAVVRHGDLTTLLYFQGYRKDEFI